MIKQPTLSLDDLRNKIICLGRKVIAIRCKYCRQWVFIYDKECFGCGYKLDLPLDLPITDFDKV